MCQSDRAAVGLRNGSIAIRVAPCLRAAIIRLQRWLLVCAVFDPQLMISLHRSVAIGSAPNRPRPIVYSYPWTPAEAQIVRSSSDAPNRWKKRRSRLLDCNLPIVP